VPGRDRLGLRLLVRFTLLKDPVSCIGEISCDGTDSDEMTFLCTDTFIRPGDMLVAQIGMIALTNHHISGFDEGPFQVVVGLFVHPAIAIFADTSLDLRDVPAKLAK
jgi:hypothetical protein